MGKSLKELFEEYVPVQRKAWRLKEELQNRMLETLKKVIPDIRYVWYPDDYEPEFISKSHEFSEWKKRGVDEDELISLMDVFEEVFGDDSYLLPFSALVFVTEEEAEKIKRLLEGDVDG